MHIVVHVFVCMRACFHVSCLFFSYCVCRDTCINDCVRIQMCVWMQTLSLGNLFGTILISLIHQQHMDGGVEMENGVRMVGERCGWEGRVDRGECLSSCHLLLFLQHTHTHTPPSCLLAVSVAGQNIVKPTGRRKLFPKWPHVLSEAN